MPSAIKIHLYKVSSQPDTAPLDDVLKYATSCELRDRLRISGHQEIRLDDAQEPSTDRRYWLLDFGNIRFASGPGKASRESPTESFHLQQGEGFAEETAALYDPISRAMLIQYNHYGPRVGTIEDYLSSFDTSVTNIYELKIVLRDDAQARLSRKKVFTKLIMKVAPTKLSASYKKNNVALATALSRTQSEFGGDYVTLEVGLDRSSNNSLSIRNLIPSFLDLTKEHDAVSELKIGGKENDEKSELINLLSAKLETIVSNLPLDSGLRIPRFDRSKALERAYLGWKAYL